MTSKELKAKAEISIHAPHEGERLLLFRAF